jgi:hypothetical protein
MRQNVVKEILQKSIPYPVVWDAALPGVLPLRDDGWIIEDEAFAKQMAERDRLVHEFPELVIASVGASDSAKLEVLKQVLIILRYRAGYDVSEEHVTRPDGVSVQLSGDPLVVAARLVQEDLCLHEKRGDQHVLTAAVICFPASWTLAEKIGKPLMDIHVGVDAYDAELGKRVQRLFDGIQVDKPLWRYNILRYQNPELFQPRGVDDQRDEEEGGNYIRSEHQALVRMAESGAVLFAIHTYVIKA